MRLLTVPFLSSAQFLSHYSAKHPDGALFFRTRTELSPDESVLIEISFPGLPNRALVRGNVMSIEPGKGAWLAFDPADASTRDFLLQLARGEVEVSPNMERAHNRFPAQLPVAIIVEADGDTPGAKAVVRETKTADVSASGVFIHSVAPPAIGTRVQLVIETGDDCEKYTLDGEVTWVRKTPGDEGFGVQFRDNRAKDNRRLRTLLRRASESGRVTFVPPN